MLVEEIAGSSALHELLDGADMPRVIESLGITSLDNIGKGDYFGVFVLKETQERPIFVPRYRRRIFLPIRLGEKVLTRLPIESFVFPSPGQHEIENEAQAIQLLEWCRRNRPQQALFFPDLFTDTPLAHTISHARDFGYRGIATEPAKHLLHRFESSYVEFLETKRSKYKNQLRRNEKLLHERTQGLAVLTEYRNVDQVNEFLRAASEINRLTYQYRLLGEKINEDERNRSMYQESARCGHFRSFILWYGTSPLCFVLGEQRSDNIYRHIMTGFDPTWRDFAPGINCNALLLKHLYSVDQPTYLDFGSGDAEYKRLFANETRFSSSPTLLPDSPAKLPKYLAVTISTRFNSVIVKILETSGLKTKLKRLLRLRAPN